MYFGAGHSYYSPGEPAIKVDSSIFFIKSSACGLHLIDSNFSEN